MSSVQNNVGRGLNIALVNGVSGEPIAARAFDMWAGDAEELLKFLRPLHEGTLVLVASYDDPATNGAANLVGPRICLEGRLLMSSVQNNVGRGLNIALVNGVSGEPIAARAFDMWAGDAEELLKFLRPLHEGTLVLVASYDDPATKLTEETRRLLGELGSVAAKDLAFRDSWVFLGAKGVQDKSPFEQHVKNDRGSNKYEGWPQALEMEGCVPRRLPDPP